MMKFLNWFFAICWVVMSVMCFMGTITLPPLSAGCACLIASTAFWNNLV